MSSGDRTEILHYGQNGSKWRQRLTLYGVCTLVAIAIVAAIRWGVPIATQELERRELFGLEDRQRLLTSPAPSAAKKIRALAIGTADVEYVGVTHATSEQPDMLRVIYAHVSRSESSEKGRDVVDVRVFEVKCHWPSWEPVRAALEWTRSETIGFVPNTTLVSLCSFERNGEGYDIELRIGGDKAVMHCVFSGRGEPHITTKVPAKFLE